MTFFPILTSDENFAGNRFSDEIFSKNWFSDEIFVPNQFCKNHLLPFACLWSFGKKSFLEQILDLYRILVPCGFHFCRKTKKRKSIGECDCSNNKLREIMVKQLRRISSENRNFVGKPKISSDFVGFFFRSFFGFFWSFFEIFQKGLGFMFVFFSVFLFGNLEIYETIEICKRIRKITKFQFTKMMDFFPPEIQVFCANKYV